MFCKRRKVENYVGEHNKCSNSNRNLNFQSNLNTEKSLHPTTVTIANITKKNMEENKYVTTNIFLKVLMDSGCSDSLVKSKWAHLGVTEPCRKMSFVTGNGTKILCEFCCNEPEIQLELMLIVQLIDRSLGQSVVKVIMISSKSASVIC